MRYSYTRTDNGHILVKGNEGDEYRIMTDPYKMSTDDLDTEDLGDEFVENDIIFYDGFAVDNNHQILLTYKKVSELMEMDEPRWQEMDFYWDGMINFYQIQFIWGQGIIYGKESVEEWLKNNTNLLAEKTFKVSAPLFVLPFVEVKADTAEQAKKIYFDEVREAINKIFKGNVDVRLLDENSEESWEISDISSTKD